MSLENKTWDDIEYLMGVLRLPLHRTIAVIVSEKVASIEKRRITNDEEKAAGRAQI